MKRAILLWQDADEWYASDVSRRQAAKIRLADYRVDKMAVHLIGENPQPRRIVGFVVGRGSTPTEALRSFIDPTSEPANDARATAGNRADPMAAAGHVIGSRNRDK